MEDHEWPKVFATETALGSTRHRGAKQPHLIIGKQSGHTVRVQVILTRRLLLLWRLPLVGMFNFLEHTSIAIPPRSAARMPLYGISGLHTFGLRVNHTSSAMRLMPMHATVAPRLVQSFRAPHFI